MPVSDKERRMRTEQVWLRTVRFALVSMVATLAPAVAPAHASTTAIAGIPALPSRAADVSATAVVTNAGKRTARLSFAEFSNGHRIRIYDVDMTSRMHLVVVGDDLHTFMHVHPDLDRQGTFHSTLTVPKPGLYHLYADGEPHGFGHRVFRFDVPFGGATVARAATPVVPGASATRAGPYDVALDRTRIPAGKEMAIDIVVSRDGRPAADLHPYLGGLAHAVFVNALDLSYLHVHPTPSSRPAGMAGMHMGDVPNTAAMGQAMAMEDIPASAHVDPHMRLTVVLPRAGTYVLWLQFRGGHSLQVARFVVSAIRELP